MANTSDGHNQTFADGKYFVLNNVGSDLLICRNRSGEIVADPWQLANPLATSLPIFVMQLSVIICFINVISLILKPLRQPRLVSDILSGVLMGASILNLPRLQDFGNFLVPFESNLVLETVGNLGLMYYLFLVGLEMDLRPIRHIGKKALSVAMAGVVPPMLAGWGLYKLIESKQEVKSPGDGAFFWSIALTVTSFPDLARILSDLKLMQTELGRTALTAALVNDIVSWGILVAAIAYFNTPTNLIPTICLVPIFWYVLRPLVIWLIKHSACTKGSEAAQGKYNETHVHFVMAAVPLFGMLSDACGSYSIFGAFLFGLIIPNGELGMKIMETLEEYVTGILLPAFFLSNGLRTSLHFLFSDKTWDIVPAVIFLACLTKVVSTSFVSVLFGFSSWDGIALGVLMNTKGVLALIVLNSGRNLKGFDQQTFAIMMVAFFLMTFAVVPFFTFTYKPTQRFKKISRRTLEKSRLDAELRVISCVHSTRHVSGMVNLLQLSNPCKKFPLTVFAMQLVELTGRNAAMLIVEDALKTGTNASGRENAADNQIISAFQSFESRNGEGVSVQNLSVVSSYANMHEDVINFADDKGVCLIVVPFHKQPVADGRLEDHNPSVREVNQNLLASCCCSVGIFVDRGLSSMNSFFSSNHGERNLRIAMLFLGGPDYREALAFAWRMSGTPGVTLTVVRFLPGKDAADITPDNIDNDEGPGILTLMAKIEYERQLDDAYVNEFRFRTMSNEYISYVNKIVNSGDETLEAINKNFSEFDLYVVGRGRDAPSALTSGLTYWNEHPELGTIGDMLVQSEITSLTSVLVVQQHNSAAAAVGEAETPLGSPHHGDRFGHSKLQQNDYPRYEAFVNHRKKDDDYDYDYDD